MDRSFGLNFRAWLEAMSARDAVLGVVAGGDDVGGDEASHLMGRKTTDFSSAIRSRLKGLGVVKSVIGLGRRAAINRSIDNGTPISDLVKQIERGMIREGRYESEMDAMKRFVDPSLEMGLQEPEYMKTPKKFADHLRGKGLSEDEVQKAVSARFGALANEGVGSKTLVVMRGVSGSGKSTAARKIASERGGVILSTDDFFEKDGRYQFDPKMLPTYHAMNQSRAEEAMRKGISPIIIDNTNTQAWEMKPYVEAGMRHGYKVEIVEPGSAGFPEVDFDEIMRRQKSRGGGKSMPEEVVRRMTDRFQRGLSVEDILNSKSPFGL